MNRQELEAFLDDINDDILYLMDGYYGGMDKQIIDKIRAKFEPLLRHENSTEHTTQ